MKQIQEEGKQTILSGVLQETFNFKNVVSEAGKECISLRIEPKTKWVRLQREKGWKYKGMKNRNVQVNLGFNSYIIYL